MTSVQEIGEAMANLRILCDALGGELVLDDIQRAALFYNIERTLYSLKKFRKTIQ